MSVSIDITVAADAWHAIADIDALVHKAVAEAITQSGDDLAEGTELSVLLCDDAFIAGLNEKWRGIAKPTNVLSFPVNETMMSNALGDIVIAYETTAREAVDENKSLGDHLSHLIVHGFLHLLGFDHEEDDEADAMEALESKTLAALGIASPFQDAEDRRPTR